MPVSLSGLTTVTWDKLLEPNIAAFQIDLAEQKLKEAVANGFDNEPSVVTDNAPNRDYHQVRPFGKIEFAARITMQDCARWIMAELIRRSPIGASRDDRHPGLYSRSHIFLINGAEAKDSDLDHLRKGDQLQIVNFQPYAGKIEGKDAFSRYDYARKPHTGFRRGTRSVRRAQGFKARALQGQSKQAKNGVYRVVLQEAQLRFGRMLFIDYAPVELSLGVTVMGQQAGPRSKFRHTTRPRVIRAQAYPCFTVKQKYLDA